MNLLLWSVAAAGLIASSVWTFGIEFGNRPQTARVGSASSNRVVISRQAPGSLRDRAQTVSDDAMDVTFPAIRPLSKIEQINPPGLDGAVQQEWHALGVRLEALEKRLEAHRVKKGEDGGLFYAVQQGDTLTKIAEQIYGDPDQWMLMFQANYRTLMRNRQFVPGLKLYVPPTAQQDLMEAQVDVEPS